MTRTISDQNVGTAQQGRRHRIRRVLITEGLLKGQTADLPDGLGCIIGGRGAGKSTLLELVRYALDAFAGCSEAELQRIASLVRDNLGAGASCSPSRRPKGSSTTSAGPSMIRPWS